MARGRELKPVGDTTVDRPAGILARPAASFVKLGHPYCAMTLFDSAALLDAPLWMPATAKVKPQFDPPQGQS
jgi:hypothetical protein